MEIKNIEVTHRHARYVGDGTPDDIRAWARDADAWPLPGTVRAVHTLVDKQYQHSAKWQWTAHNLERAYTIANVFIEAMGLVRADVYAQEGDDRFDLAWMYEGPAMEASWRMIHDAVRGKQGNVRKYDAVVRTTMIVLQEMDVSVSYEHVMAVVERVVGADCIEQGTDTSVAGDVY